MEEDIVVPAKRKPAALCPFCKSDQVKPIKVGVMRYQVACLDCKALGPLGKGLPDDAIEKWDTRA
jgi:hypothetical protein